MAIDVCIKNSKHFNVVFAINIREGNLAKIVKVDSLAKIKSRE